MQSPPAQAGNRAARCLSAIGNCFWRQLSLVVIVASWAFGVLHTASPRDVAGSSFGRFFVVALLVTAVTWLLIWLLVKHDGQKAGDLGLSLAHLKKSLLPGILSGLGIFALCNFFIPLLARRWLSDSDAVPLGNWFQSPETIPAWIFLGWIAGGLTEEASRVFVLTRFERTFGRTGLITALILSSVIFGIGHLYQGHVAALTLGMSGALYALVYLRRRICWEAVVAHATFDTIAITLLFCTHLK